MKCPTCKQKISEPGSWTVKTSDLDSDENTLYWVDDEGEWGAPVGQEKNLKAAREELTARARRVAETGLLRSAVAFEDAEMLDYAAVECAAFELIGEKPELSEGDAGGGIRWSQSPGRILPVLRVRANRIANEALAAAAGGAPGPTSPEEVLRAVLEDPRFSRTKAEVRAEILRLFTEKNKA